MDFAVKVSWAALLSIAIAKCENHTDVIKKIAFELSSYFHTSCFLVFHGFDDIPANFDAFKALSSDARRFVGVYSFSERRKGKTCFKPMNILIGEELKGEFASFTNRDSMTDEVWVVFVTTSASDFLNKSRPSFDSEIVVAEIQSLEEVQMWEVYSVDDDFPLRISRFGNWTEQGGLILPNLPLYDRRSDLEGKVMRIGSNENWPICTFNNGKWDGYMPKIWMELENLINCTTMPVRSVDNATGLQLEDGSWNGLMGMLIKGDLDVIAAELTLTKARVDFIEFSYPAISARRFGAVGSPGGEMRIEDLVKQKLEFLMRYQIYFKALGYRLEWKAIFKPLSLSTWLALVAWMIIGSICISISYYCYMKCGFQEDEKIKFTQTESFFFILQTLCQQGYPVVPKSLSCRILFVTAYALSTIMIPSYSASLISSLTYQAPIRPFDSLEEMVNDGKYKLLVKRNSAAFAQFSKATDSLYTRAYEKLVDNYHANISFDDTVTVLDDIICKQKNYALYGIDLITSLKMEHKRPKCFILKLSKPLSPVFVGLGLRMDSPFSRIIDYKLQKLKNIGAISRLQYNLHPLGKDSASEMVFRQVEVNEIFQVFFLLLAGMIFAVVILMIELVVWRINGRSVKRMLHNTEQNSAQKHSAYMICFDLYID